MRRVGIALVVVLLWTGVAAYGALSGWWLTPVAPAGDARAFMDAAIAMSAGQSRGNIALVLLRRGEIYAEHFAPSVDPVDRETRFPLASMSKWITAYGVMHLVQAGRIDLDAPVSRYLKRWQLPAGRFDNGQVTVRRLLSHTAGLTDGLGFADYAPDETLPSLEETLRHPGASSGSPVAIAVGREPGSAFLYSGGGYLVLQALVEDVTGLPFADYMQRAVLGPLGMEHASYEYIGHLEHASRSFDASGTPATSYQYAAAAATGLSASPSDLVAFVRAQRRAPAGGGQSLAPAFVDAMRQPHGRKAGFDIWGMGVALYAPTRGGGYVFGHDGANAPAINTSVRVNPDNDDAIIVLVTGNPTLASRIGSEWTLWQTGVPDFLTVDKAVRSAVAPWLVGLLPIALAVVLSRRRARRRREHGSLSSP